MVNDGSADCTRLHLRSIGKINVMPVDFVVNVKRGEKYGAHVSDGLVFH